MNENLQPPTQMSIKDWLSQAASRLRANGISSLRLDSELILANILKKDRTFLQAHCNDPLTSKQIKFADRHLEQRINNVPIAYILGKKEFYGREFIVSSDTLIPRPESEEMIDGLKYLYKTKRLNLNKNLNLIDVGAGSGILGITVKLELPKLNVTLSDISNPALLIAEQNSKNLSADVKVKQSDLLNNCKNIDIILANLPYVDPDWNLPADIYHEPSLALFADKNGLQIIEKLLLQTDHVLNNNGLILMEADPCQHEQIIKFANDSNLKLNLIRQSGYILTFQKN